MCGNLGDMTKDAIRIYKREWQRRWRLEHPEEYAKQKGLWKQRARGRNREKELNPEYQRKVARAVARWRLRNPEKIRAHRIVFAALRNGTLEKEPCFCDEEKVQAHHEDYSKPLEVMWLCRPHHKGADELRRKRELKAFENTAKGSP